MTQPLLLNIQAAVDIYILLTLSLIMFNPYPYKNTVHPTIRCGQERDRPAKCVTWALLRNLLFPNLPPTDNLCFPHRPKTLALAIVELRFDIVENSGAHSISTWIQYGMLKT